MLKKSLFIGILIVQLFSNLWADEKTINLNTLKTNNKQIMVFFHMNNCGYCNRMDKQTFQDFTIKQTIEKEFLMIDINIDEEIKITLNNKTYSARDFASYYEVHFFPTVIFLDDENEISYKARGFRSVEKFQHILNFMKTKSFENMSFFEYLEEQDKE